MEITASNFIAQLPYLRKSIDSADFISFDTEFSGKHIPSFVINFRLLRKVGGSRPRLRHA